MTYRERYKTFYNSKDWKQLRKQVLSDNDYLCEECRQNGKVKIANEVHHIEPIDKAWDKRLDYNNLQCLCSQHHAAKSGRDNKLFTFLEQWGKNA